MDEEFCVTPTSTDTERKPIQKDIPAHVTMKDMRQLVLRGRGAPEKEYWNNHILSQWTIQNKKSIACMELATVLSTQEHTAHTEYVVPGTPKVLGDAGSNEEYIIEQMIRSPIPVSTPTQCSPSIKLTCTTGVVCTGYIYEDYRVIIGTKEDYCIITEEDLQGLTNGAASKVDYVWQGTRLKGMPSLSYASVSSIQRTTQRTTKDYGIRYSRIT